MVDLKIHTAWGVLWKNITNGFQSIIDLVATAALARLLVPEDFGVVTMSMIFVTLAFTIKELGLGAALIQRRETTSGHLDSAFWSAVCMGVFLQVLFILSAPALASFFRTPALREVLPVLSLNFMFGSLGIVHKAMLEREMRFDLLARCDVGAAAGFGVISVGLAMAGAGVWSIVVGKVLQHAFSTLFYWISYRWKPGFNLSLRHLRELMGFGANVMAENMTVYFYTNVDYALVGRFLGSTALGLYGVAYRIVTQPLMRISVAVMGAVYPAFCRVQDDPERMVRGYLITIRHLAVIVTPLMVGLMALAPELVTGIFGEHWAEAVLPLQIMVAAGLTKAVGAPVNSVFRAFGRPDVALKVTLAALGLTIVGVSCGIPFGIAGVALGISASSVSAFLIAQVVLCRLLSFNISSIARALLPASWLSVAMLALLLVYRYIGGVYLGVSGLLLAATSIIIGTGFYYCALRIGEAEIYREFLGLLRGALLNRG